jgi:hypothetical protein
MACARGRNNYQLRAGITKSKKPTAAPDRFVVWMCNHDDNNGWFLERSLLNDM